VILRFKGKVFQLMTQKCRLPNGYVATIEVIRHPGAVVIIPLLKNDRLILLRQFRPVLGRYLYELPAGTKEKNESFLQCAKREIMEETAFKANKFSQIGRIYPVPGYSTEEIRIFKAEELQKFAVLQKDEDEILETHSMLKSQVRNLFKTGKILDAKTICALTFLRWL